MINVYTCKKTDFNRVCNEKKLICFGAGEELNRICKEYQDIEKQIEYVVDNNKKGQEIRIQDRVIPVVSPEEINTEDKELVYIISTINYADQIILQLDSIEKYNKKNIFIPYFFYNNEEDDVHIEKNGDEIIPRIIHYCWFGKGKMPEQFEKNIDTWKKYCPDYKIVCWNESNYDVCKNKYMKQAYEEKKWGFVPDYARLDIVNQYGGIYLDTDVEMLKPWDNLLNHKFFCGYESEKRIALGLGFGGVKNNKILIEMLKQYDKLSFYNENGSLNLVASPVYQTEIMKKYGLKCDGSFQESEDFVVYPAKYFAPINSFGIGNPSDFSYSIHQYAASWCEQEYLLKKKKFLKIVRLIKERLRNYDVD